MYIICYQWVMWYKRNSQSVCFQSWLITTSHEYSCHIVINTSASTYFKSPSVLEELLVSIQIRVVITDIDDFRKTFSKIFGEQPDLLIYMMKILASEKEAFRKEVAIVCIDVFHGWLPHTQRQHGGSQLTEIIVLERELQQTPRHRSCLSVNNDILTSPSLFCLWTKEMQRRKCPRSLHELINNGFHI